MATLSRARDTRRPQYTTPSTPNGTRPAPAALCSRPGLVLSIWNPRTHALVWVPRTGPERLGTSNLTVRLSLLAHLCPPSAPLCPLPPLFLSLVLVIQSTYALHTPCKFLSVTFLSRSYYLKSTFSTRRQVPDAWFACQTRPSAKNPVHLYSISATPFLAHAS